MARIAVADSNHLSQPEQGVTKPLRVADCKLGSDPVDRIASPVLSSGARYPTRKRLTVRDTAQGDPRMNWREDIAISRRGPHVPSRLSREEEWYIRCPAIVVLRDMSPLRGNEEGQR